MKHETKRPAHSAMVRARLFMVRNIDAGDACTLAEFAAAEFGLYDDATGIPDWLYELAEEVIETANA